MSNLIGRIDRAISAYATAKGSTRVEIKKSLEHLSVVADVRRAECEQGLTERDSWFWRNPNSSRFAERTDWWIATLREYEEVYDAWKRIESILAGESSHAA